MAYELDFIGIKEKTEDSDAIGIRWKNSLGNQIIGVFDGGIKVYGEALKDHINKYYFEDDAEEKIIDFVICSHSDRDHASGLSVILENFTVKALYMNRPWLYVDELYEKVNDGRITKESLKNRLRDKYQYIANLETLAEEKNVPIYEVFQGIMIESKLEVYSPTKSFYMDLLVESDKTPLEEKFDFQQFGKSIRNIVFSLMEKWTEEMLREDVSTAAENEMSVIICGNMDEEQFLLTGDAGIRALNIAMDYSDDIGNTIKDNIKIYQIPHHGGRHNLSPSIMDRLIGEVVEENQEIEKEAIVSAAKDSDHPLKMVTNAFIRRGVIVYQTSGKSLQHSCNMPDRDGWSSAPKVEFSNWVEEWI